MNQNEHSEKLCVHCNTVKPLTAFYRQNDRKKGSSHCKSCFTAYCSQRFVENKIKAIKYKGGKCRCGISYPQTPYVVFDFHHTNPKNKEAVWEQLKRRSWKHIVQELDKCELLCSNCHRLEHYQTAQSGIEPESNA